VATSQGILIRFRFLAVVLALAGASLPSNAQSVAGKMPRVGLLGVTSAAGYSRQVEAMRLGFRDLSYVEGRNIVIEYRWADGQYDRLPALAAELIHLQPDVIITSGPGTRVLRDATTKRSSISSRSSSAGPDRATKTDLQASGDPLLGATTVGRRAKFPPSRRSPPPSQGLRHLPPSRAMKASASFGPQEPASYCGRGPGVRAQWFSTGSVRRQACSIQSPRE
jgi:hypothetical protein